MIGYSLPVADSYIKYLLRAAVVENPHLKSFDVLCLDPDQSVHRRYSDFVVFPNFRFMHASVEEYLQKLHDKMTSGRPNWPDQIGLNRLEEAHNEFFRPALGRLPQIRRRGAQRDYDPVVNA